MKTFYTILRRAFDETLDRKHKDVRTTGRVKTLLLMFLLSIAAIIPAQGQHLVIYGPFSDGSVSGQLNAGKGDTVTLAITPDAGYDLYSISAYNIDYPAISVDILPDSGFIRSFEMPDYDVTVTASFRNLTDVQTAKRVIESYFSAIRRMAIGLADSNEDITELLLQKTNRFLANIPNIPFGIVAGDITISSESGSYNFRVRLSETVTTAVISGTYLPKKDCKLTVMLPTNIVDGTDFDIIFSRQGDGKITIEYKRQIAGDEEYTGTKPTDAGRYNIRVRAATTSAYSAAEVIQSFTILSKEIRE
jgi:hypothetical protein